VSTVIEKVILGKYPLLKDLYPTKVPVVVPLPESFFEPRPKGKSLSGTENITKILLEN
jgi:hypothetical protein